MLLSSSYHLLKHLSLLWNFRSSWQAGDAHDAHALHGLTSFTRNDWSVSLTKGGGSLKFWMEKVVICCQLLYRIFAARPSQQQLRWMYSRWGSNNQSNHQDNFILYILLFIFDQANGPRWLDINLLGPTPPPKPLDYQDHCHGLAEKPALASPWVLPAGGHPFLLGLACHFCQPCISRDIRSNHPGLPSMFVSPACLCGSLGSCRNADSLVPALMKRRCVNRCKAASNTEVWEMESQWPLQYQQTRSLFSWTLHIMTQHQML